MSSSLIRNISPIILGTAISKFTALVIGIILFLLLPLFDKNISQLTRWGILLWYPTVAGLIGAAALVTEEPFFNIKISWWLRGVLLGTWMNTLLVLFATEAMIDCAILFHLSGGSLLSPFWFVVDGTLVGLLFAFIVDRVQKKTRA